MTRPRTAGGLAERGAAPLLWAALLAAGCASALREPPRATGVPPAAAGRSGAELLDEARGRFARRPDPVQVRRAEELFLAAAQADPTDTEGLAGAVEAKGWLLEHAHPPDGAALATSAVDAGQLCLRRAPESARCHYALGLALGLQARERHATAIDGLKRMVDQLERARAADPALDSAGPDRILATVLVRAPGWPVGPGDPEAALSHARAAVDRFPAYPPNQLALAEALLATGHAEEGHAAARRAAELAREPSREGAPDAPEWLRAADRLAGAPASPGT